MDRSFSALLGARQAAGLHLCVGLDPASAGQDPPPPINEQFRTCTDIVDATKDVAAAFKPNSAFFEAYGPSGLRALERLIAYIHQVAPEVPVILDVKRGDIGNTMSHYAVAAFDRNLADAVTINPYLGMDVIEPILKGYKGKGIFVLALTSNDGSGEFQKLPVIVPDAEAKILGLDPGTVMPLYQYVSLRVERLWDLAARMSGNWAGLVVGATYAPEIGLVRELAPTSPLLIPGIGSQGGDLEQSVTNASGGPFVLNASSSIAKAANPGVEARKLTEQIQASL